jgi:hypothetical protein
MKNKKDVEFMSDDNKLFRFAITCFFIAGMCMVVAVSFFTDSNTQPLNNHSVDVYYFYKDGCPHCTNAEITIKDVSIRHPYISIGFYEVSNDITNRELFLGMNKLHNIDSTLLPEVIIGESILIGDVEIKDNFERIVDTINH